MIFSLATSQLHIDLRVLMPFASAAVLFMEHWKRRQMRLNYFWDLTDYGMEEEVGSGEREMQKTD